MTLREPLQRVLGSAFIIEGELTGGGMAHLYVALDTALNRRVVVKVLPRERAEGVSAERFRGEIRTVAALQHPNIVGILAAGEVEGLPYYMMPYIDGESLRGMLVREGSLSPRAAVAILRDVARACSYAHARGIVHRDIKPDNVLLSGGAALITDFGIAKALSVAQRPQGDGTLTRDGFTVGTPRYMAPEQLAGDPKIDHRVDFYAMGVMAYEMLAGEVPFSNPTPRALLAAQLSESPKPLRQIRPDVPLRLAKLVSDCLKKEPDDRPASADEILSAIDDPALLSDEFLAGRSGESRYVPTETLESLRGKRRTLRMLLGAMVVSAVVGGAVLLRSGKRAAAAPATGAGAPADASVALLPFVDQSTDSSAGYIALGLTDGVTTRLAGIRGLRVIPAAGTERYRTSQATALDIGKELKVGTLITGTVKRAGDSVAVTTALIDVASGKEIFNRSVTAATGDLLALQDSIGGNTAAALATQYKFLPKSAPALRSFQSAPAYDEFLQGRYALRRGATEMQHAIQFFHQAQMLDSSAVPAYLELARLYAEMPGNSTMTPDVALPRALAFAERAVALDSMSSKARLEHGLVLEALWRWPQAREELHRAVVLDSMDAAARQGYGEALLLGGDAEGATRELSAAARLNPYSPKAAGLYGIAQVLSGQVGKGVQEAQRAVDLDPTTPAPRILLGAAYLYAQRSFDAVFTLAGAMELDPSDTQVLGLLGYAYAMMGQPVKARAMLTRLAKNQGRPGTAFGTARIYIGLGQPDDALRFLEQAVQAHDPLFAAESMFTPIFEPLSRLPRFGKLVGRVGSRI